MKKIPPRYQTYLITGKNQDAHRKTQKLASSLGIDILKPSADISTITPLKKHISIDQIRDLKRTIFQKPLSKKPKLIIIQEAQKLTVEAQNALLKILEEPPKHAIIILEASDKSTLLPTIISRSTTIRTVPSKKVDKLTPNLLSDKSIDDLLLEISAIANPDNWLDSQMLLIHQKLLLSVQDSKSTKDLEYILTKCLDAKKMIDANVNPKFVLASLIFSLNPKP